MALDIVLIVIGAVLMIIGIIGCIVPFIPGPPLCYVALLMLHFTGIIEYSTSFLLLWAGLVIAVVIIEYLIPMWGTKMFGGTSAGEWGSAIGVVLGIFFFPPWGIILGPAIGAFVGELIVNKDDVSKAMKSAVGSLVGFILGTGLKLAVCVVMAFYFVKDIIVAVT